MAIKIKTKDDCYLDIALSVSKTSTCLKKRYGCIVVKDDVIVATGHNGNSRGSESCLEKGLCKAVNTENCISVHAEQNALLFARYNDLLGATLYLACETFSYNKEKSIRENKDIFEFVEDKNPLPCSACLRIIKNARIAKLITRGDTICL